MKISEERLGFIGFGHMAQIIFEGLDKTRLIPHSQIFFHRKDPKKIREAEMKFHITSTSLAHLVEKSSVIILAVRPSQMKGVLEEIKKCELKESQTVITIAVGLPSGFYEEYLPFPIIRVMPNVASSVQEGMSIISGAKVSEKKRGLTRILFSALGQVLEVEESLMNISSAIAGSGPGFVFSLIRSMAKAGEEMGLCPKDALTMTAQTFLGAAKLIVKGEDPLKLLDAIATPSGTTEAGLRCLTELNVGAHLKKVVQASVERAKELSQQHI